MAQLPRCLQQASLKHVSGICLQTLRSFRCTEYSSLAAVGLSCGPSFAQRHFGRERDDIFRSFAQKDLEIIARFGSRGLKTQKVVLTEKIERLGRAGQVVNVAPGYARNKLIPHHLALPGLDKYVSLVNAQLKAARPHLLEETEEARSETSEDKQLKEIDAVLKRLDAGKVVFRRDLTGSQVLYSPVTKDDLICEVRRQMGIELAAANIVLPEDLSKLGEFDVELRFPPGLTMPGGREKLYLKIRVRRK